jgi:hypothetical protein
VPEVIDEGVTGFVVDELDAAVRAVDRCARLDRRQCRAVFERRFTAARMASDYLAVYRRVVERARRTGAPEDGRRRGAANVPPGPATGTRPAPAQQSQILGS